MRKRLTIGSTPISRGETRDLRIRVSETYLGRPVDLPVRVVRAAKSGPIVFVTAAVHGDELNGTGIIRELMFDTGVALTKGTLILVPAVNIFGFESHTRYMPDRRDLNRSFPGSASGSLSSRVANVIFETIVAPCDYGIDLHTAAARRTNFPNVRGDLTDPEVRRIASAFGCELMVNSKGPDGSLRRTACKAGCPTIILEAGEPGKIEPSVLEIGVRGVRNVLTNLEMLSGPDVRPAYQTRVDKTVWLRAETGGLLFFHVVPGEIVEVNQPIATTANVFGKEHNVLVSPVGGIVLGMTTFPNVKPGDPVCHVAIPKRSTERIRKTLDRVSQQSIHQRLRDDLATNISVSEFSDVATSAD